MFLKDEFCSGERFQKLCDVYCGTEEDLNRNPIISSEPNKHMRIDLLVDPWDNPSLIFCYSCSLTFFMEKLTLLKNKFVLVSHNEDTNIDEKYITIANHRLLIKWYCQNLMINHEKLSMIPIGIANGMWTHGNLDTLETLATLSATLTKSRNFYFYFKVDTNRRARQYCKSILESKGVHFGNEINHYSYLCDLASHKFAICPEGNGIDSHRLWECYYLGVIPIVLRSVFTEHVSRRLPCIILNSWEDFSTDYCLERYEILVDELKKNKDYLRISYYRNLIKSNLFYEPGRLTYYLIHGNSKERENYMLELFKAYGIHNSDVNWIRLPNRDDPCLENICINREIKPGGICCTYKHYLALKDIVDKNLDMAVIMEDNVGFHRNVPEILKRYMNDLSPNWDCVFDSSICNLHYIEGPIFPEMSVYKKKNEVTEQCAGASRGCNFVMVNKKSAKIICDNFLPIFSHPDFQHNEIFRRFNFNSYWPEPVNAFHNGKLSTVLT